jgi:hypothetical protein
MLIARWQIDARFGCKQKVIDAIARWTREIAPKVGLTHGQMLSGSVGALEATVEHNWQVADLGPGRNCRQSRRTGNGASTWNPTLYPVQRAGRSGGSCETLVARRQSSERQFFTAYCRYGRANIAPAAAIPSTRAASRRPE